MITYRNFIIEPICEYSDKRLDGYYYQDGDEGMTMIHRQTMAQVKSEIDTYWYERQSYKVGNSVCYTLEEAFQKIADFGGIVEPLYNFDSI